MLLRQLFDRETSTYTYLVADEATGEAALIDPVAEHVDRDLKLVSELALELIYVLDTHVHADHVTGSGEIRKRTGAKVVGSTLGASCSDVKVAHGDVLPLGKLALEVLETPGHTDDSVSYRVGDDVFTGDTMLVRGTGRADFQNGDPEQLYTSLTEILFALPDHTCVWPGHDYRGHTTSTVGEEKRLNPRVAGKSREQFVEVMNNLRLPRPKKLDVAVPTNRACGQLVRDVDPDEAYANRDQIRVVDVRERDEFNGDLGHIPSAQLVPLSRWPAAIAEWDPDDPVIVVCRSDGRSTRAAHMLVDRGFTRVMNLRGGMLAYSRKGLPVARARRAG